MSKNEAENLLLEIRDDITHRLDFIHENQNNSNVDKVILLNAALRYIENYIDAYFTNKGLE